MARLSPNDDLLHERAFGFHDQGHKPSRMGVEVGNRSIIGMNMRMNELTGAVSLAQLRKLDAILATLREKKAKLKKHLIDLPNVSFRKLNDEKGECATLLTLLFDTTGTRGALWRKDWRKTDRLFRLARLQQHGAGAQ